MKIVLFICFVLFSIESFALDQPIQATIRTVSASSIAIDSDYILKDVLSSNDHYNIKYEHNHTKVIYY